MNPAILFNALWNCRAYRGKPQSVQHGVAVLRESTKLNHQDLAKHLLLSRSQVIQLESHGRPLTMKMLERLEHVANSYQLFQLADYFKDRKLDMEVNKYRRSGYQKHKMYGTT